jgi:GTP cyclohydrolase I
MTEAPRIDEIAGHLAEILDLLGWRADDDPELAQTPQRVAALCLEWLQSSRPGVEPEITLLEHQAETSEMIRIGDLPFHSICAHHLLPFFGHAQIAYVPGERLIGLGGIGKVLNHFARRPQLQERLTEQVAESLQTALNAQGVIVLLQARHLCMEMRGEKTTGLVETTAAHGCFQEGPQREEFFRRVKGTIAP